MILEPTVMILEKIEKPGLAKEGSVPNISWGKGSIPSKIPYFLYFLQVA